MTPKPSDPPKPPHKKLADVLPDLLKDKSRKAPISMPAGLYLDMPPELYYNTAAIGSSLLKYLADDYTPEDFRVRSWMNLDKPPFDTKALRFGRAQHMLMLEPNLFDTYYTVKQGTKSSSVPGCIGGGDFDTMRRMRDVMMSKPKIYSLITGGHAEVSLFWEHESGAPMRARFDYLKAFTSVDLKFVEEISDRLVGDIVARFQYDTQGAHYHDGLAHYAKQQGFTEAVGNHVIILQEKAEGSPHKVKAIVLEADVFGEGKSKYDAACRKYSDCVSQYGTQGRWPDYEDKVESLDATMMPRWWSGAGIVV